MWHVKKMIRKTKQKRNFIHIDKVGDGMKSNSIDVFVKYSRLTDDNYKEIDKKTKEKEIFTLLLFRHKHVSTGDSAKNGDIDLLVR